MRLIIATVLALFVQAGFAQQPVQHSKEPVKKTQVQKKKQAAPKKKEEPPKSAVRPEIKKPEKKRAAPASVQKKAKEKQSQ